MNTRINATELYKLCNKHRMFTCGDNRQYDKMFELTRDGITQDELAYILYLCSDYTLDKIYEWIAPLFNGGAK